MNQIRDLETLNIMEEIKYESSSGPSISDQSIINILEYFLYYLGNTHTHTHTHI